MTSVTRTAAATIVENYYSVFDDRTRAAHRACLEHARVTRKESWPTIGSCLDFAKLYDVSGADLAALFGYLSYTERGRTTWVDALRGPESSHDARQRATPEQAKALGFLFAFSELTEAEGRA